MVKTHCTLTLVPKNGGIFRQHGETKTAAAGGGGGGGGGGGSTINNHNSAGFADKKKEHKRSQTVSELGGSRAAEHALRW